MDCFWAFRQAIGLAAVREAVEGMAALRATAREADRRNIVCEKEGVVWATWRAGETIQLKYKKVALD